MDHHRLLERLYLRAPTNAYYQPEITIGAGTAEIRIPVKPDFYHAAHAVHGSVYFKAADDACFFAVNSLVEDVFVLTASFSIELLRPLSDGAFISRGEVVHQTRGAYYAECTVQDQHGTIIALGNGRFVRSKIPLDERVGYF